MDTASEQRPVPPELTAPEIAELGVDLQMMYQRVRRGLGLPSPDQPCIGRYRIKAKLGEGGMGVVYLAYDPKLERDVAIKLVTGRPLANTDRLRARLLREAQLLAKLRHPNVVTVHDTGEHAGEVFLAMEYVAGQSLREWQETPGRSRRELLRLYIEAGFGLAAAHKEGIIHRDFKPDNVLVDTDAHALVGDFGLAHPLAEPLRLDGDQSDSGSLRTRMTRTGELLGTIGYMAPEQLCGDEIDARTDQYAYCVALWEAVAGTKPFEGETREALLAAMRGGEPSGSERLPAWLRRALRVGLSPTPGRRYPSMSELIAELERGLRRGERWKVGGAFGLAALITISSLTAMWTGAGGTVNESELECPLAERIDALAKGDEWMAFRSRLDARNRVMLELRLAKLEDDAYGVCGSENKQHRQLIKRWIHHLDATIGKAAELSDSEIGAAVAELDREYLVSPPPVPLSDHVNGELEELTVLFDQSQFDEIVARSTKALEHAESEIDEAELRLHRGRAFSLEGKYEPALQDFREAVRLANRGDYDDARLRAYLLEARTTIMRLENVERGSLRLADAEGLLERPDQPAFSRRRADYLELSAALELRLGAYDEAAYKQRLVVLRHTLVGSGYDRATALTNLGMIEEYRGDVEAAERCYREALEASPTDPEAMLNLARVIVNRFEDEDAAPAKVAEARTLLDAVLASEHSDLYVLARVATVQLELAVGGPAEIEAARNELVELLRDDQTATPTHRSQALGFVAVASAALGDLGPVYETAFAELVDLDDPEWLVEVEFGGAQEASEQHPAVARELFVKALARLESMPEFDRKPQLMAGARAGLERLELEKPR